MLKSSHPKLADQLFFFFFLNHIVLKSMSNYESSQSQLGTVAS